MFIRWIKDFFVKRSEYQKRIIAEETLLDALMLRSKDAILTTDLQGTVTSWNHGAEAMLGYGSSEIVGNTIKVILKDKSTLQKVCNELKKRFYQDSFEQKLITKDNKILDVSTTMSPIINKKGHVIGASLIARDETEEKNNKNKLAEANLLLQKNHEKLQKVSRAKDIFLAKVSHDLRSPLNVVLGYLDVLEMKGDASASVQKIYKIIRRNAMLQLQLVDDLIDMSSISSGTFKLNLGTHDIEKIVDAAIDGIRVFAEAKGIQVIKKINVEKLVLVCDQDRIHQVLHNLLRNSVKFTPKGGTIEIEAKRKDKLLVLSVSDTGRGIETSDLNNIFNPNWQGDDQSQIKEQGLGLGLSISKQLIEAHGGVIYCNSEGENKGTKFSIQLPVKAIQQSKNNDFDITKNQLQGVRILVAEDSEDAREIVSYVLEEAGAEVVEAEDGQHALNIIDKNNINIILSDIDMPFLNGYEFIKKTRQIENEKGNAHRPAIALSAFTSEDDIEKAYSSGFDGYLTKPVSAKDLVNQLMKFCG